VSVMNEWLDLVKSPTTLDIDVLFSSIYKSYTPTIAGLITAGFCPHNCLHCIYSKEFSNYNKDLDYDTWLKIVDSIYRDLKIRTFVHNGRTLDNVGINVLKYIRDIKKDCNIGLILDGSSIESHLDDLISIQPDWVDVSIDGLARAHDTQRGRKGAYRLAEKSAIDILESDITYKVNILSCLTTINVNSIQPMLNHMNKSGFKNFFISPVTTLKDYGPSSSLVLNRTEICSFVTNIMSSIQGFNDTWVEFVIFDAHYFSYILQGLPDIAKKIKVNNDHLSYHYTVAGNEFFIKYYPLSLVGIREFDVNCNGDVMLPKMMAKGKMEDSDILGSMLTSDARTIFSQCPSRSGFGFFLQALMEERMFFQNCISSESGLN